MDRGPSGVSVFSDADNTSIDASNAINVRAKIVPANLRIKLNTCKHSVDDSNQFPHNHAASNIVDNYDLNPTNVLPLNTQEEQQKTNSATDSSTDVSSNPPLSLHHPVLDELHFRLPRTSRRNSSAIAETSIRPSVALPEERTSSSGRPIKATHKAMELFAYAAEDIRTTHCGPIKQPVLHTNTVSNSSNTNGTTSFAPMRKSRRVNDDSLIAETTEQHRCKTDMNNNLNNPNNQITFFEPIPMDPNWVMPKMTIWDHSLYELRRKLLEEQLSEQQKQMERLKARADSVLSTLPGNVIQKGLPHLPPLYRHPTPLPRGPLSFTTLDESVSSPSPNCISSAYTSIATTHPHEPSDQKLNVTTVMQQLDSVPT
jgi:hypothetical protein